MGDAPCPVTATGCVPRDRQGAQAAGSAACPGKGPNFPERSMPIDEPRLNAFLGRALNDMGAAMSATLILIGDQLGLYKALARQPMNARSEEHTSELQSLMRISYAVFCLKKTNHSSIQQH